MATTKKISKRVQRNYGVKYKVVDAIRGMSPSQVITSAILKPIVHTLWTIDHLKELEKEGMLKRVGLIGKAIGFVKEPSDKWLTYFKAPKIVSEPIVKKLNKLPLISPAEENALDELREKMKKSS